MTTVPSKRIEFLPGEDVYAAKGRPTAQTRGRSPFRVLTIGRVV